MADKHPVLPSSGEPESRALALTCAAAADSRKGTGIVLLRVGPLQGIAEYFVIASGTNPRQVRAMADEIERRAAETGARRIGVEGRQSANWILLDFGDVICHLFLPETRDFYNLTGLWGDAESETFAPAAAEASHGP